MSSAENPCSGKCGHAEAARDVVLAEHRIGRQPQTQTLGEDLGLFQPSFRHQDYEFVAAVPGHHIGLAALLFQQAAHSCQHQIAFHMPKTVVNLFELVEIDQHHRERPPRAEADSTRRTKLPRKSAAS